MAPFSLEFETLLKTGLKASTLNSEQESPLKNLKNRLRRGWGYISFRWWRPRSLAGRFLKYFLLIVLCHCAYVLSVNNNLFWLFGPSPTIAELQRPQLSIASTLYTADGEVLGKYFDENRTPIQEWQVAPVVFDALVATEDERFYDHAGIDFRAFPALVVDALRGRRRGGSTITQQLAKNLYHTRTDDRKGLLNGLPLIGTLINKSKEWILAVRLERNFTKREILTKYLNTVTFGNNSYGIFTASRTYFGKNPSNLDTTEAALLIGLLKAPTYYSPTRHPERAIKRRNVVLQQMAANNFLDSTKLASLQQIPVTLDFSLEQAHHGPATYFRGVMNNYLKDWCKEHGYDLYRDGLKIYTTIDSRVQARAEEAVAVHMEGLQRKFNRHWEDQTPWVDSRDKEIPGFIEEAVRTTGTYEWLKEKYGSDTAAINRALNKPKPMKVFSWKGERDTTLSTMDSLRYYKRFLHAGFMAMDPFNGHILAWVGGIDFKYFKYDHVYQSRRQPGSTFKPFVYATAFEQGYSPCDYMVDAPVTIRYEENGEQKAWSPHNADWIFTYDTLSLRRAMARSINSIAAQMTEKVGWERVAEVAKRCGIQSPLAPVPSIGLGSSDVSVYELTGAYATFMNKGIWNEPLFITRIEDRHGKVLHTFRSRQQRGVSEQTAFLMMHMLKGTLQEPGGTVGALFEFDFWRGNELAGKTGTSSNHSDGWFVGLSKDLVAGMWVGGEDRAIHFRTSALGEGSKTALPIFGHFMERLYADTALNYKMGRFPKWDTRILKTYNCPGRRGRSYSDTLQAPVDSLAVPVDTLENIVQ